MHLRGRDVCGELYGFWSKSISRKLNLNVILSSLLFPCRSLCNLSLYLVTAVINLDIQA